MKDISKELTQIWEAIDSLKENKVIRTKNLVGELGEYYCKQHLGIELFDPLTKKKDGKDRDGKNVEIKTRCNATSSTKVTFTSLNFDYCLYVELGDYFQIKTIHKIPADRIRENLNKSGTGLTAGTLKKHAEEVYKEG